MRIVARRHCGGVGQLAGHDSSSASDLAVRREKLHFCPSFVTADDASTVLTVLEAALPGLRLEQRARLAAKVPAVVLTLTSDWPLRMYGSSNSWRSTHAGPTKFENQASFS